jgi:hypothetical protein
LRVGRTGLSLHSTPVQRSPLLTPFTALGDGDYFNKMSAVVGAALEEGKLLSEALSTVKIQVQQMKRHLVRIVTETYRTCIDRGFTGSYRNWTSSWTR